MRIVTGGCSFSETRHCVDYHRFGMMDDYEAMQPESGYKSWALHLEDIVSNLKGSFMLGNSAPKASHNIEGSIRFMLENYENMMCMN